MAETPLRDLTDAEIADLPPRFGADAVTTAGVERDGALRAAGMIDPLGTPATPDAPAIEIVTAPGFDTATDLGPLLQALLDRAEPSANGILARWDPMDARGLKVLEQHGFKPVGEMPYFDRPGGTVEYVTGYADAVGSLLDLRRR